MTETIILILFLMVMFFIALSVFCIQHINAQDIKLDKMNNELLDMHKELERVHRYMIEK